MTLLFRRRAVVAAIVLLVLPSGGAVAADRAVHPFVVGGTTVATDEYGFMVSLQKPPAAGDSVGHFCGGTLIDTEWVLTAAHCVGSLQPEEFRIAVGATRLSAGAVVRAPAEVHLHPDYDGDPTHGADVALVRLAAPVDGVRPVEPARPADRTRWEPGDPAEVVGWGVTTESGTKASDELRRAAVAIQPDEAMAGGDAYGDTFLASDMVGAGHAAGGIDACRGDSGGPLLIRAGRAGLRQVGITSFGRGCGRPGHPGVYSRLGEGRIRAFADSLVPLRAAPIRVVEGRVASFRLALARPSTVPASVAWETVGQSAREGSDFTGRAGVAEFAPGQTVVTVDVRVTADTKVEGEEAFRLQFSRPVNVWLPADSVTATIADTG